VLVELAALDNNNDMLRQTTGLLILTTLGNGIHAAYAQNAKPYAGANAMLSTQGANVRCLGNSGAYCPKQGVEGTAIGASVEVGTFLTPRLSLAFETSVPARFESTQAVGLAPPPSFPPGSQQFTSRIYNRHRELIFSGLFHVHITPTKLIRLEAIAGPSVVREDTLKQQQSFPFGPNDFFSRDISDPLDGRVDNWRECRGSSQSPCADRSRD
jgi:hypothetical protein